MTLQQESLGTAPAATLKAIGHGRALTFDRLGVPAVLVCVARETSDAAGPVVSAIRERYPSVDDVLVISLADTRPFPRLIRKIAETIMKSSYNSAVKDLQPGRAPEDYVLIVPDWDGEVLGPLGIADVSKTIAVAVFDSDANLIGVYQGDDPTTQALAMLERARR